MKPRIVMFGAIGVYSSAFSRAVAAHSELLGCVVRRPLGEGFAYWFRHQWIKQEQPSFACPLWAVAAYNEAPLYKKIHKLAPELVVSCGFPRRLPAVLAQQAASYGAVNLHPALLPMDRGPQPLFWSFRRGDRETGVSLQVLAPALDEGDVIAQQRIAVDRGIGGAELFARLGTLAGELLVAQMPRLLTRQWAAQPQGASNAWARKPAHADWEIKPEEWSAQDLWHFVRGARAFGTAWARLADEVYYFDDAPAAHPGVHVPGVFVVMGNEMLVRVRDGGVRLRLVSSAT